MKIEYYLNKRGIFCSPDIEIKINNKDKSLKEEMDTLVLFFETSKGIKTIGKKIPNRTGKKIVDNFIIYNRFLYIYDTVKEKVINIDKKIVDNNYILEIIKKRAHDNLIDIENKDLRRILKRSNENLELISGKNNPQVFYEKDKNGKTLYLSNFDKVNYNFTELELSNLFKYKLSTYPQKYVDRHIEMVDKYNNYDESSINIIKKLVYFPDKTIKVLIRQLVDFGYIEMNKELTKVLTKEKIIEIE